MMPSAARFGLAVNLTSREIADLVQSDERRIADGFHKAGIDMRHKYLQKLILYLVQICAKNQTSVDEEKEIPKFFGF